MTLRWEPNVGAAAWFTDAEADWAQLSCLGPPGYPRYARVLHSFEPDGDRHSVEDLVSLEGRIDAATLGMLLPVLAAHTSTPGDCLFGLWDGWGMHGSAFSVLEIGSGPVLQRLRTSRREDRPVPVPQAAFSADVLNGPRVRIPHRGYLLFRGPLVEAGQWPVNTLASGQPWPLENPQLMWPADRAWFVATDVDQPWTGIGGSPELIADLVNTRGLDVLRTGYDQSQPYWRHPGIPAEEDL